MWCFLVVCTKDSNRVKPSPLFAKWTTRVKNVYSTKNYLHAPGTPGTTGTEFRKIKLLRPKCRYHSTTWQAMQSQWDEWWMATEQSSHDVWTIWAERFESLHKVNAANPNICQAGEDTHWYTLSSAKPLYSVLQCNSTLLFCTSRYLGWICIIKSNPEIQEW